MISVKYQELYLNACTLQNLLKADQEYDRLFKLKYSSQQAVSL